MTQPRIKRKLLHKIDPEKYPEPPTPPKARVISSSAGIESGVLIALFEFGLGLAFGIMIGAKF